VILPFLFIFVCDFIPIEQYFNMIYSNILTTFQHDFDNIAVAFEHQFDLSLKFETDVQSKDDNFNCNPN
jgi:hypothetical protein